MTALAVGAVLALLWLRRPPPPAPPQSPANPRRRAEEPAEQKPVDNTGRDIVAVVGIVGGVIRSIADAVARGGDKGKGPAKADGKPLDDANGDWVDPWG